MSNFRPHLNLLTRLALALIVFTAALTAQAATITVDSNCSLANAVRSSNDAETQVAPLNSCESGDSGHDTISLTADVTLDAALNNIVSPVTLNGAGYSISGADSYRIFNIRSGASVTIENVTLYNGNAGSSTGGAILQNSTGTLTISNSVIRDSTGFGGGGISVNNGAVTIKNSSIYSNRATRFGGGGVYVSGGRGVTILNSSLYDNFADGSSGSGGAIYVRFGSATLTHVTMHDNRATQAGGVRVASNRTVTMRNSIISNSTSDGSTRISDCLNEGTLSPTTSNGNLIQDGTCSAEFSGEPGLDSNPSGSPPYYALHSSSRAVDAVSCDQLTGTDLRDQRGNPRPHGSQCDIGAYEGFLKPRPQTRSNSDTTKASVSETPSTSVRYTGETLVEETDIEISATYGLQSGIQVKRLDGSGVGNQAVLDLGFLDAIDVWAYVSQGAEVCFPESGGIVFLDAATAPRTVTSVISYTRDGMTCAYVDRAGTLVLVSSIDPPEESTVDYFQRQATPIAQQALSGCTVTTAHVLNFRETTGGDFIIGWIPNNATLTALARTPSWFNVDFHGTRGWISADYVTDGRGLCLRRG